MLENVSMVAHCLFLIRDPSSSSYDMCFWDHWPDVRLQPFVREFFFLPVSLFCPARHTVILINVLGPTSGLCVLLKVNCWCWVLFSAIDADWSPPRSHTSSHSFTSRTKCTQAWTCCMVINNVDRFVEEGNLSSEAIREQCSCCTKE